MKILFLSSEVAPFSKTGGLGDVVGALPKALKSKGHEVRVITPCYQTIKGRRYGLRDVSRLRSLTVSFGGSEYDCDVKSGFIPGSKVQIYFLHNPQLFDRDGLYVEPETESDYADNEIRFAYLCHGALQLLLTLQWIPDIIHCNDWQTGLVPYLIKRHERYADPFRHTRSIIHIHNAGYQGLFPLESADKLELKAEDTSPEKPLEFYGKLSFLKAGVATADAVATVSPTYAKEIQTDAEYGFGMEGLYRYRSGDIFGVRNGVDVDTWNPATDKLIPRKYDANDFIEGKAENKAALQERMGIEADPTIPLIGMVSRLAPQKGFGLLEEAEKELLSLPAQFVCLGAAGNSAEESVQAMWTRWRERHPRKIGYRFSQDEELAHLIEAGADMLLVPSRYEPCGLSQLYALLYGTVPVVRRTGGLADTVIDYSDDADTGNGFGFTRFTGAALTDAIDRALSVFANRSEWETLQRRGMSSNFSWGMQAEQFISLYRSVQERSPYMG